MNLPTCCSAGLPNQAKCTAEAADPRNNMLDETGPLRGGAESQFDIKNHVISEVNSLDLYPNDSASLVGWKKSNFKYDIDLVRPPS